MYSIEALLHVGRVVAEAREMQDWGVHFPAPEIDIDAVRSRKEKVIGDLTGGLAQLAKRRNVQVLHGQAIFTASNAIEVSKRFWKPNAHLRSLYFSQWFSSCSDSSI